MGVVYKAFDLVVERQVALKTIHVSMSLGIDLLDILRREARSVGRFEHANIVTLFDAGEIDGMFCMVMQLVDGESLRDRLQRQRWFKTAEVIDMFRQILAGLGYAHERGIVHRDMKPANIMISGEGVIKLADFGIAKLIDPHASSSGLVIGTPSYMSPEQVLGRPVDARSDIFSVGCTLYEVLTGEKAFPGDSASSVMYKIVHQSPAPPAGLRPGTDPCLQVVALKALANNPEDRYTDCREMAAALLDCLSKPAATPDTAHERSKPALASTKPNTEAPRAKLVGRRARTALRTAAAIVVSAVFVVIFFARKPARLDPRPAPLPPPATTRAAEPLISNPPPSAGRIEQIGKPLSSNPSQISSQTSHQTSHRPASIHPQSTRPVATPDDFTAMSLRGDVAYQQGDYESALAAYRKADALKPGDPGLRRKLKVVFTLLGRAGEAQKP